MRLFIGVKISMDAVEAVSGAAQVMRAAADAAGVKVRWVAPAAYHVTLKFIGEARPEVVPAVRDSVREMLAGQSAFDFATRSAGAFPGADRARVLWVGVDDPGGHLTRMAGACEKAVVSLGFKPERRPFHPHVTVGRLREVADCQGLLLPCTEQGYSETRAESVTMFESITKSSGSEYVVRAEWPLSVTPAS